MKTERIRVGKTVENRVEWSLRPSTQSQLDGNVVRRRREDGEVRIVKETSEYFVVVVLEIRGNS